MASINAGGKVDRKAVAAGHEPAVDTEPKVQLGNNSERAR